MTTRTILGFQCKLYRNSGTYGSPVWAAVDIVKDLTLPLDAGEADSSSRESEWATAVGSLKNATVDFGCICDPANASWVAMRDAWLNRTPIEFLILDGSTTAGDSQGLRASFAILKFSRNETLPDVVMTEVSMKPTRSDNAPAWTTVTTTP